jgi:hypothetical protein
MGVRDRREFDGRGLEPIDPRVELLVARVGVCDRGDRARVPGEALGEEEVLRGPIDVRDRGVAERVEFVVDLKARFAEPVGEEDPSIE